MEAQEQGEQKNEQVIEKSEAIVDTVHSSESPSDAPPTSTTNWFQSMSDLELEQCNRKSFCVNTDWAFRMFNNLAFLNMMCLICGVL